MCIEIHCKALDKWIINTVEVCDDGMVSLNEFKMEGLNEGQFKFLKSKHLTVYTNLIHTSKYNE